VILLASQLASSSVSGNLLARLMTGKSDLFNCPLILRLLAVMPEAQIKIALIQLHAGIKVADGAVISQTLGQLEELLATHRDSLHPQLVHFLAGRSYAKALAYLGGGTALTAQPASPPGGCGGQ